MKKTLVILACAFSFAIAMPLCAETANTQAVAQQDDKPLTKELLTGDWNVEDDETNAIFSFKSNGKLVMNMSETISENGMTITVKIDVKDVTWKVKDGNVLLNFDKASIDLDVDLPEMLAGYKDMLLKEFDGQKKQVLNEAKKLGNKPIAVQVVDHDNLLIQLEDEPVKMVRIIENVAQ